MHALDLIKIQLELECIGLDAAGLMVPLPCPEPDDVSRFYIARHAGGYARYFRHDLAPHIRDRLSALPPRQAFDDHETVKRILLEDAPCEDIWVGKSYVFPRTLTPGDYPDALRLDETHRDLIDPYDPALEVVEGVVYAVIVEGQIAATCQSSRENHAAAEAWVRTLPLYRRRGYARQVVAAWAHGVQGQGKIPFYSHRWDNLASQGVARSLNLIEFITGAGYK